MARIISDRVLEVTSTTGTGTLSLGGAPAGSAYQTFINGIGGGNTTDICIRSGNGTDWEIALDCLVTAGSPATLTRGTFDSSSTGSPLNLSGTSTVYCDFPTARRRKTEIASKTGNYSIVAGESRTWFNNTGASGSVIYTLPAASAGLDFGFVVTAAQTLEVLAVGSDIIALGGSFSAAAGNVQSAVQYCSIRLQCHVAGIWIATSVTGTWSVT